MSATTFCFNGFLPLRFMDISLWSLYLDTYFLYLLTDSISTPIKVGKPKKVFLIWSHSQKNLTKSQTLKVETFSDLGDFKLLDLIISRVINHVTCPKFDSSHWLKLQHSDWREHFNFQLMRALEFIKDCMVYNPAYNQILQTTETIDKL